MPTDAAKQKVTRRGKELQVHLPDTRGVTISPWGLGNLKLGPKVYSYSRLPGRPGVHGGTCPGSTPECLSWCYAFRIHRTPDVWRVYEANTKRPDLPDPPEEAEIIRLHVSGDFDTVPYVYSWYKLARSCSARLFGYTRSWRVQETPKHDREPDHFGCDEVWLAAPGYNGIYEVSDCGNVRRIRRGSGADRLRQPLSQKLSGGKEGKRYLAVALSVASQVDTVYIHRLVARAFLGEPSSDANEVNHRDWNRLNNHARNLEWVNHAQQMEAVGWHSLSLFEALERFRALPNVQLFASIDASCTETELQRIIGWRWALIETDPRLRPVREGVWKIGDGEFSYGLPRFGITCPEEVGRKPDCESCNFCILGKATDIIFLMH